MAHDPKLRDDKEYDVFISHASEDKDFVDPLANKLRDAGLRVWYDNFELKIGDSLNESINKGLSQSRFGVVVLSPSFFEKHWTRYEMNGLVARQVSGQRVILPIWHRITREEILEQAPPLADTLALNSSTQSIDEIVAGIVGAVKGKEFGADDQPTVSSTSHTAGPKFAIFYVATGNTNALPPGTKPERVELRTTFPPIGWLSVVSGDEELEYVLEEKKLRLRINWGNHWDGDELWAHQMMSGGEPFAIVIRRSDGPQLYFPTVVNTSPSSWLGSTNRSGWMVFEIQS